MCVHAFFTLSLVFPIWHTETSHDQNYWSAKSVKQGNGVLAATRTIHVSLAFCFVVVVVCFVLVCVFCLFVCLFWVLFSVCLFGCFFFFFFFFGGGAFFLFAFFLSLFFFFLNFWSGKCPSAQKGATWLMDTHKTKRFFPLDLLQFVSIKINVMMTVMQWNHAWWWILMVWLSCWPSTSLSEVFVRCCRGLNGYNLKTEKITDHRQHRM